MRSDSATITVKCDAKHIFGGTAKVSADTLQEAKALLKFRGWHIGRTLHFCSKHKPKARKSPPTHRSQDET